MGFVKDALRVIWSREEARRQRNGVFIEDQDNNTVDSCVCFLTPWDSVKYSIPGIDKSMYMPEKKFMVWVSKTFPIKNWNEFDKWLHQFLTLHIQADGSVTIIRQPDSNPSYSKLLELNTVEENETDPLDTIRGHVISSGRKIFDTITGSDRNRKR